MLNKLVTPIPDGCPPVAHATTVAPSAALRTEKLTGNQKGTHMSKKNVAEIIRENKTVFIVIAVALFLIELEIFAVAVMKSGRKSWLQVLDNKGNIVHETDGDSLSDFNKYYFEKTFGPFENYEVRLQRRDVPFPFRAWFVAAVGIPMGIILMFAFIVKAYLALFYGESSHDDGGGGGSAAEASTSLERIVTAVSGFNIFTIGFLILLGVVAYWIIPNVVTYLGQVGLDTLSRYKWVFITAAVIGVVIFIWMIYLRYLLARKAIDSQMEMNKYRMKLEFKHKERLALEHLPEENEPRPMVSWDGDDDVIDADEEVTESHRA